MDYWKFENNNWLWALAGIPVLLLLFWVRSIYKHRQLQKLGNAKVRTLLIEQRSTTRPVWKNIFLILALVSLTIAIANPQTDAQTAKVKIKGAEIIIALDISNSMKAEDISPNRLEKAKLEIMQMLRKMKNDRVGLIVFAGKAFIPVPLTTDYAMIRMYLKGIDTDLISTQGTDMGAAISLATKSFSEDGKKNKTLIVITDGENHEENAVEVARKAYEQGITIHTIGLGKQEGVPVPITDRYGRKEYRKDKEGNVIVSRLNESLLHEIAAAAKGQYVRASNYGLGLDRIYDNLKQMEKQEFQEKEVVDYEDNFQLFLWIALGFLILEFILLPRKNSLLSRIKISEMKI